MEDAGWTTAVTRLHWADEKVLVDDVADLSERDQWWRMTYDATYGYPGEGPMASRGRSQTKADLRTRVQPVTEQRYRARLAQVEAWLHNQGLPSVGELVAAAAWNALDVALLAFVQHLHNQGSPISYGTWALAAVQYHYPSAATHIPRAWLGQRQWSRLEPLRMRPPMPARLALALAVTAWVNDWRRSALALLLAFQALLRPAEVAALRRQHIVLPEDLAGSEQSLVICVTQSKTTHRAARLQSVMINDPTVVALAGCLLREDSASAPLIRGGLRELHKKFDHLRASLDLSSSPFTLSTLRGGGAVWHIQQSQSIAMLQWRGRWSSERSVQHYLQLGLAATALASLSPSTRAKVEALANLAGHLLNPDYNGLRAWQTQEKYLQPRALEHASQNLKDESEGARERKLTAA
eukprot:2046385-Amphidinium_carterae.1